MFLFLSPLTFFGLPLFLFLFLCLSVVLFCFPSFLSFFFAFFLFLVFVSFFPFLSSLLFFHEKKNIKIFNCNFFLKCFLFCCFLSCFSVSNPFFLSLLFPDFKLCFLFNINVFISKRTNWKAQKKQKKNNCNKTGFFYEPVFCKMSKVIVFFLPLFCKFLVDVQKNTIKIGISANF